MHEMTDVGVDPARVAAWRALWRMLLLTPVTPEHEETGAADDA